MDLHQESDFQRYCAEAGDLLRSASGDGAAKALQSAEKCLVKADQAMVQLGGWVTVDIAMVNA